MTAEEKSNCKLYVEKLAADLGFDNFDVQFDESKKAGYLGEVFKVKIIGKLNGNNETLCLIAKHIPIAFVDFDNWICERYHVEAQMYDKAFVLFDKVQDDSAVSKKLKHAKVYKTILENKKQAIIMEDLATKGFRNCKLGFMVDLDHAEIILEEVAKLHALSFALKFRSPDKYEHLTEDVNECFFIESSVRPFKKFVLNSIQHALEIVHDNETKEKLSELAKEMPEKCLTMIHEATNTKNAVLGHGDLWTNNFLFKYTDDKVDDVVLIDWQTIRIGSPVLDVIFFLLVSVNANVLSTKFQHLLNTYHNKLCSCLRELDCNPDEIYSYESFSKDLKDFSKLPITQALIMLPAFTKKTVEHSEFPDFNRDDVKAILGPDIHTDEYITQVREGIKVMIEHKLI